MTKEEKKLRTLAQGLNIASVAWANWAFGSCKRPDFNKGAKTLLRKLEKIDREDDAAPPA